MLMSVFVVVLLECGARRYWLHAGGVEQGEEVVAVLDTGTLTQISVLREPSFGLAVLISWITLLVVPITLDPLPRNSQEELRECSFRFLLGLIPCGVFFPPCLCTSAVCVCAMCLAILCCCCHGCGDEFLLTTFAWLWWRLCVGWNVNVLCRALH